jgi:hypothetical protein
LLASRAHLPECTDDHALQMAVRVVCHGGCHLAQRGHWMCRTGGWPPLACNLDDSAWHAWQQPARKIQGFCAVRLGRKGSRQQGSAIKDET